MKLFLRIFIVSALTLFINCGEKESVRKDEKNNQDSLELVKDTVIYNFINHTLLTENEIYKECNILFDRTPENLLDEYNDILPKIDSIFTKEDLYGIKKQYENNDIFILDAQKIKSKNVVKVDSILYSKLTSGKWEDVDKLYQEFECFSILRIPIFNKSKDMAIVEVSYSCGLECGKKGVFLYKKNITGKWELYLTLREIFS